MLGKYNRIEQVEYNDGTFGYLLTGDNVPFNFEVDMNSDWFFNTDFIVTKREVAKQVNNLYELLFFCSEHYIDTVFRFNGAYLTIGGERDCYVLHDLSFCWKDDYSSNLDFQHSCEDVNRVAMEMHLRYNRNLQATDELMGLFDSLMASNIPDWMTRHNLHSWKDYVLMYEGNYYTFETWEELIQSEVEQGKSGLTEDQCKEQLNHTIWQLPCGWYVQYV